MSIDTERQAIDGAFAVLERMGQRSCFDFLRCVCEYEVARAHHACPKEWIVAWAERWVSEMRKALHE